MKVLFISAPIGSGHVRAAQAVGAALRKLNPTAETHFANVFDFFPAFIGKGILHSYLRILSIFPKAYSMAYGWGNTSDLALRGRKLISSFLAARMWSYIKSIQPDIIVCTHATPAGLIAELLGRGELKIPAVAIVTDFVLHRLWIYPDIPYYCVAQAGLCRELAVNGIATERSLAYGIPVHDSFVTPLPKREAALRIGIDPNIPTVLIMGGGAGVLPIDSVIAGIETLDTKIQILAVCGNNQQLKNRLSNIAMQSRHPVNIYGFVNNIAELMSAADFIVTKPGGVTCAEALCCGLPILIYKPIPGQEEGNAQLLAAEGAALRADTPQELIDTLTSLIEHGKSLTDLKQKALKIAKPEAADSIAKLLIRLVDC